MRKGLMTVFGILMMSQVAIAEEVKLVMWQHEGRKTETEFYQQRLDAFNKAHAG